MAKGKHAAPREKVPVHYYIWALALFTALGVNAWAINRDPGYPPIDSYLLLGITLMVSAFTYAFIAVLVTDTVNWVLTKTARGKHARK